MCREKTINFLPLLARCRCGGAYESGSAWLFVSWTKLWFRNSCSHVHKYTSTHRCSKSRPNYGCEEWPLFLTEPAIKTLHFHCPNVSHIFNAVSHLYQLETYQITVQWRSQRAKTFTSWFVATATWRDWNITVRWVHICILTLENYKVLYFNCHAYKY